MDAKKSDVGDAHERGIKSKIVGAFVIAALIAMAVFVGTAAANGGAEIYGSRFYGTCEYQHNFNTTTDDLYGWGDFGGYSDTHGLPPCPDGCGGRVYVVEHQETWTNGDPLIDVSSDGYETLPWGESFFEMAWPTPLTPGTYDLILDLNVSGPGNYSVWTNISDPVGGYITDPIWVIYVAGPPGPGIRIVKTASTNGVCPGSDPLSVYIGDNVTYCFNVTNTGNKTLTNISLFDDHYGAITLGNNTLEPGKSLTNWTVTYTVTESDIPSVINTATVNSTYDNKSVNDTDVCTLNVGYNASIEIEKTAITNGTCPGSDPLNVSIGDTVTYCFNVTNTGNVTLKNVAVFDDHHGVITLGNDTLLPGKSLTNGTKTYTITESDIPSVTNIATVNATDPAGKPVISTDTCTIAVDYIAGIEVNKTASISGSCPGSDPLNVSIGDTVTYCFNVTNTGNVTLKNVAVFDDHHGVITLGNDTLLPGKSLTNGTKTYTITESDIPSVTNIATVNATDPAGKPVISTDTCTIAVDYIAGIEVNKTASISGSCPGSDPLNVSIGDTVTYCFNVTNTGNVTLKNVAVFDDHYYEILLTGTELAPGEYLINDTITHIVTEGDIPSVTNNVTVDSTDPDNKPLNDSDNCTIIVGYNGSININKTVTTGSCPGSPELDVDIGDTVTYCFEVTNTGDVTLDSVTVDDDIYGYISDLGTMAPGDSATATLLYEVTADDFPEVINTATVTGTDPLGDPVSDSDSCTINGEYRPGIEIIKTAYITGSCPGSDPLNVNIGDNVTYCFNVTNTGDVALTDITVDDDIYGPVELDMDMLQPGESLTNGTITHIVSASDIPSVTNTATVNATDPASEPVNATDTCTLNVDYDASIEIDKTASTSGSCPGSDPLAVVVGDTVTYCFNVTNTGNVSLSNISVSDDNYGVILFASTVLAPGASFTNETVTHPVTESDIPSVVNTATVNSTDPDLNAVNATDTCTLNVDYDASIEIDKTASTSGSCPGSDPLAVVVGDTVTYCFNVTNTGNVSLSNISVSDDNYGVILFASTVLAPGASFTNETVTHPVTESDIPSVVNTATVNSTDPDLNAVNATDTCTLNVDYDASIEIDKTASTSGSCPGSDPLAVVVGDTVTYCFNVTNTGNVSLSNISVSDDHYREILFASTVLAPGASFTNETITHPVTESDIPSVTNTVTANSTDPYLNAVNATDTCTLNVDYNASIEIVKTAYTSGSCPGSDPLSVDVGDTVTYCFNVTNTGNVSLSNISVSDDNYGVILFASTVLAPGESITNETITHIVSALDIPSVVNTATVNSTDPDNKSVNATDICTLNVGYNASIEINKTASISGSCPGSDPLAVYVGDTVTYCFNVTNTGNVSLSNVTVSDDRYGAVTLGKDMLVPGESTGGNKTHTVTAADIPSVINTATVNSTDPGNKSVNNTDDCMITVDYNASIEIVKTASTNGVCPGSDPLTVHIGDTVTYCFNVTNTGNVSLSNVTVSDNRYGAVTLGKDMLVG